jgi:hypothetical protein
VLTRAEHCLRERFEVRHSTLQLDIGRPCGQAHHDVH